MCNARPHPNRFYEGKPEMTAKLWSAVTCHRFSSLDDLSSKQCRVQRRDECGRVTFNNGDKSPAKSAAESAHSKA
jgi:hypothetical protein